jgi:hypothetical protein
MISRDQIRSKKVVDLECGLGAGPQVFANLGAQKAFGIDYYLGASTPQQYPDLPEVEYLKIDFAVEVPFQSEIDFIYLNNASEHIKSVSEYEKML